MIGALIGDYIGSIYEWHNVKTTEFPLFSPTCCFTDDSVMSVAVAEALMNGTDMGASLRKFGRLFPSAGYGGRFRAWLRDDCEQDYGSYGNGSAMRASAAGWIASSLEEALTLARLSTLPTHSHPEGVRGAEVVAGCIWLLRHGKDKNALREWVVSRGYQMDFALDDIRAAYEFDVSCQGSVPQAVEAFLEADDFESAVRLGISIGGDSDTIACITGSLAEACWGIPDDIVQHVVNHMPLALYEPLAAFERRYAKPLPAQAAHAAVAPPALTPLSSNSLSRYWSQLSARYSARQNATFAAYDVFIHEMQPVMKRYHVYNRFTICPFTLLPLIAYYAEGMLSGSSQADEIDAGPCSIRLETSHTAAAPNERYMLPLIESAINGSQHLRDYMRRRVNTLHEEPAACSQEPFARLIRLQEEEFNAACERGDDAQAWLIFGLNQLLTQMQMLA